MNLGSELPTEPGTYALVVILTAENHEFITLNNVNLPTRVWNVFTVTAPVSGDVVKIDAVFTEVEGGYVFGGFVDAEGNAIEIDSSLYSVYYESNEVYVGTELPTAPGGYAVICELAAGAPYEFITLSHPAVNNKVWQGFQVVTE